MSTITRLKTQVVIFGGGVAGLWLLNRLRKQNINCLLVENNQLGGGQTIFSQGIIHSGVKYALNGKLTVSAEAMKAMPEIWRACLHGEGEIDLSQVTILSEHQYLWSPGSLAANLAVFLASKNLKSQVSCLAKEDYPEVFSAPGFKGAVYALEEPVLAVKSLIETLAAPHIEVILHAQLQEIERLEAATIVHLQNNLGEQISIEAENVVLLAGKGNQNLAQQCGLSLPKMQLRPLLMVSVTAPQLPKLFAHAMQVSDKPRITITTHQEGEDTVWYLGGDLAETGVNRTPAEQVDFARKELTALFPRLDFSAASFQTFFIERAEAEYPSNKKPEGPTIIQENNIIVGWPTKLAFAPLLAQQVMDAMLEEKLAGSPSDNTLSNTCSPEEPLLNNKALDPIFSLSIADYPWEHQA